MKRKRDVLKTAPKKAGANADGFIVNHAAATSSYPYRPILPGDPTLTDQSPV
jgi:hypothetical protein